MLNQKGFTSLFLISSVIVVLVLIMGVYYLGTQKNQATTQQNITTPTKTPFVAQSPVTPNPTTNNKLNVDFKSYTYTDSKINYSFKYPSNWNIEPQYPIEPPQLQLDLTIKSPDYALTTEGIEILKKGSVIYIYRSKTNETSIDKKFETDKLAGQIAKNKTSTIIDGQKAIQYDYSYEGTEATDSIFIKNGNYYLIKLQTTEAKKENDDFSIYSELLDSFKAP